MNSKLFVPVNNSAQVAFTLNYQQHPNGFQCSICPKILASSPSLIIGAASMPDFLSVESRQELCLSSEFPVHIYIKANAQQFDPSRRFLPGVSSFFRPETRPQELQHQSDPPRRFLPGVSSFFRPETRPQELQHQSNPSTPFIPENPSHQPDPSQSKPQKPDPSQSRSAETPLPAIIQKHSRSESPSSDISRAISEGRCKLCQKNLTNKYQAQRHYESIHTEKNSWLCNISSDYKAAFRTSTTRPDKVDSCGYCGQNFTRAGADQTATIQDWEERIEHLRTEHKFWECDPHHVFKRKDGLRRHLCLFHNGKYGWAVYVLLNNKAEEDARRRRNRDAQREKRIRAKREREETV